MICNAAHTDYLCISAKVQNLAKKVLTKGKICAILLLSQLYKMPCFVSLPIKGKRLLALSQWSFFSSPATIQNIHFVKRHRAREGSLWRCVIGFYRGYREESPAGIGSADKNGSKAPKCFTTLHVPALARSLSS